MNALHSPMLDWWRYLRFGLTNAARTDEIHDTWRLKDGTAIRIRAARTDDGPLIQRLISNLSLESRYHRFFYPLHELTPDLLARFTQADPTGAMNLLAVIRENGGEIVVGMVQYVADPYPGRGEFAAVVADAWQRTGIATRLLRNLICIAKSAGIERLEGDLLSENEAMIGLMISMGFDIDAHTDGAYLMMARKEVAAPAWKCSALAELGAQRRTVAHA